ncbi:MAG: HAD family hydrolase [Candidatus Bipolaricaulota bacterium]|nr:HAD family hydrolase [Candidatus Bipolaricaulota bacterium]
MKIKLVSFDADGTLVENDYVNSFWFGELPKLYAEKKGIEFEEAREALKSYYDEIGDEDIRWYKPKYWFERFDLEKDPEEVIGEIQVPENVRLFEDALDATKKLRENYRLIVTSNAPRIFLDYALKQIENRFYRIFSCVSDFGEVKKNAGVYRRVLNRVGTSPEESVHVGDHWKFDYQIPRRLGMRTFYIEREGDVDQREDGVLGDLRDLEGRISEIEE